MQEHWQQINVAYQPDQSFPVDLLVREFGVWTLGFRWLKVSLGQAATTGIALYAWRQGREPQRHVVFKLKDAIGFMAPYVVAKQLATGKKGSLEFQHSPRFYFGWRVD